MRVSTVLASGCKRASVPVRLISRPGRSARVTKKPRARLTLKPSPRVRRSVMPKVDVLVATITLVALAAPALAAQTAGGADLAGVCKSVGDAKPGEWASFDATGKSEGGTLRLAVVGSERSGDTTL